MPTMTLARQVSSTAPSAYAAMPMLPLRYSTTTLVGQVSSTAGFCLRDNVDAAFEIFLDDFVYAVGLMEGYESMYLKNRKLREIWVTLANNEKIMRIDMNAEGMILSSKGYPEYVKGFHEFGFCLRCKICVLELYVLIGRNLKVVKERGENK